THSTAILAQPWREGYRSASLCFVHIGIEREAEGSGGDARRGAEPDGVDVGEMSIRIRRGVLSEDERGICGFGVGDFWAVAGGRGERDRAAGGIARSGRTDWVSGEA